MGWSGCKNRRQLPSKVAPEGRRGIGRLKLQRTDIVDRMNRLLGRGIGNL
jgi:hypothetical protein